MFVHTCRCIFSFVLIGFYYKRKRIQKLFENGFGILEMKKEKEMFSFLCSSPKACCLLCIWPASPATGPLGLINQRAQLLLPRTAYWAGPTG
jgi:hypothetical protein